MKTDRVIRWDRSIKKLEKQQLNKNFGETKKVEFEGTIKETRQRYE